MKVNDRVTAKSTNLTGTVTAVNGDNLTVWWDELWDEGPDYLKASEVEPVSPPPTKQLPSWAIGWCFYCGTPASGFAFFDEIACRECGGS
jgi:hypothetical protein